MVLIGIWVPGKGDQRSQLLGSYRVWLMLKEQFVFTGAQERSKLLHEPCIIKRQWEPLKIMSYVGDVQWCSLGKGDGPQSQVLESIYAFEFPRDYC